MTFTFQNIPNPADLISTSQGDLKNNFQYFQASLNKDHQIVFSDTNMTTFEGRHRQVSLKNLHGIVPTISDGADSQIFSDNGNLWANTTVVGAPVPAQLTTFVADSVVPGPTFGKSIGWTFLPGGLIMQYGTASTAGSTKTVTYPIPFPTGIFSVVATIVTSSPSRFVMVSTSVSPTTQFVATGSASAFAFNWIAIGN